MDTNLRPSRFSEFTGQHSVKSALETATRAARERGDALEHLLLCGPPGLGKTSLAQIIAREMNANITIASGPTLETPIPILRALRPRDVLFIDEIHALDSRVEEMLYPAMEDYRLDLQFGSRVRSIPLNKFTLIGATTMPDHLRVPLRQRFGISLTLDFYNASELSEIVRRAATRLAVPIEEPAAYEIARRSRGTPRIALSFLRRARDTAQLRRTGITLSVAQAALDSLGVDSQGLNQTDRNVLSTIVRAGGHASLNVLSAATGESENTIQNVTEPFLIRTGLLTRSSRGRAVTRAAYQALGIA